MLFKKMLRDIKKNLSQFITIFLMTLIGVMVYSGIEAYMYGMKYTADTFYSENNLQDINLIGTNFTDSDLETIKNIDNVKDAERRLTIPVTVVSDEDKALSLTFIESNNISKFYVYDGVEFDKDKSGIWLDNFYCEHNNLKVGDTIKFTYDGYTFEEKILGKINVPDHLYDVKDASELYPDHDNFGFAFISINEFPESYIKSKVMKEAGIDNEEMFDLLMPDFNYKDYITFSNVIVDIDKTSAKKINKVKEEIEDKVDSCMAIINIEDTMSYATYQGEIEEGETYIGVFSGLFLFIAMLSVITTMTRVVKKQRIQIGTLKALGFNNFRITTHYIGYGFWIALVSSIFGLLLGRYFIGNVFIGMEMSFFSMPNGKPVLTNDCYLVAVLVVLAVSLITYITCRSELKENPSESLRVQMPKVKEGSLNITNKGIFKKLGFSTKWNLRDILRNKVRTITGIAGVGACCLLIVTAFGMLDSINNFIDLQFTRLYNFDYKLNIKEGTSEERVNELKELYGDSTSMTLGIEIKTEDGRVANTVFVHDANDKIRFIDNKDEYKKLNNKEGIYVTYKLASQNNYSIGDEIEWHIYGSDTYYKSKIVGFNKDPQNQIVTMTRDYLETLDPEIKYVPDSLYTDNNLKGVKAIDGVELIQDLNGLKESMASMLETMQTMVILIIVVAIILGIVIIYNLGILSYTEKQYQFATLKVLGFSDKRIRKIFIKQQIWIAIASVVIGCPLGFYLVDYLFKVAIADTYDFSAHILPITYVYAIVGTLLLSYLVSLFLSRKIKKIDMVSSLKGNE